MWPDSRTRRHMGWVCCWFNSLLQEVFLRVLRFSPLLKYQHLHIPIRSGERPNWCSAVNALAHVSQMFFKAWGMPVSMYGHSNTINTQVKIHVYFVKWAGQNKKIQPERWKPKFPKGGFPFGILQRMVCKKKGLTYHWRVVGSLPYERQTMSKAAFVEACSCHRKESMNAVNSYFVK